MIIPDKLSSQLEKLITILDNCYLILSKDRFNYNEDQIDFVNSINFVYINIDKFKKYIKII